MKKFASLLLFCFLMVSSQQLLAKDVTVRFKIFAGKCSYSKSTIKKIIKEMGGKGVQYSFKTQMVEFNFDNEEVNIMDIHKKIAEAGFKTLAAKPTTHAFKMLPACAQYNRD